MYIRVLFVMSEMLGVLCVFAVHSVFAAIAVSNANSIIWLKLVCRSSDDMASWVKVFYTPLPEFKAKKPVKQPAKKPATKKKTS